MISVFSVGGSADKNVGAPRSSGCCTLWMLVALNPEGRKRQRRRLNAGEEQTKNLAELFGTAFMLKTSARGASAAAAEIRLAEHLLSSQQQGWRPEHSPETYHDLKLVSVHPFAIYFKGKSEIRNIFYF